MPAIIESPIRAIQIWNGGMSFHGGLTGTTIAMIIFAKRNKIPLWNLFDIVSAVVPIGLFFGRIANFINGELWGRQTDAPLGVIFCNETIKAANRGACPAGPYPRHPSQLYEAALEGVLLFLILNLAVHKLKWLQRRGALTATFLICYGLFRAALENVRNPDHGMPDFPFGLTMGMILSIPMLLVGGWLLWRALRAPVPAAADDHEPA
jgi:phosphatidylglycerol:prolipoprotein diacylglycerol transferase